MSNHFLTVKELGDLYIKQVIVQYDYPLLFICEDQFDTLYIVNEITDSNEYEEWIASKLTRKKYMDVLESRISLRDAFIIGTEMPYIVIRHYYHTNTVSSSFIYNPPEDYFPEDDVYMSTFCGDYSLIEKNTTSDSAILEVEAYPGKNVDGIDITMHNNICSSVCGIADGLFGNDVDVKIMIPKAASYSFQFKVETHKKHVIESQNAIEQILNAIISSDENSLSGSKDILKVMEQSRKFLNSLEKTKDDFILIYDGKDDKKVFSKTSNSETVARISKISDGISRVLEREKELINKTFNVEGELLALNLLNKTFSIRYVEEYVSKKSNTIVKKNRTVSGKLSPEFNEGRFVGFEFCYEATIKEIQFNKKLRYELLSLVVQPKLDF